MHESGRGRKNSFKKKREQSSRSRERSSLPWTALRPNEDADLMCLHLSILLHSLTWHPALYTKPKRCSEAFIHRLPSEIGVEASTSRSMRLGASEKEAIEPTFRARGASKQKMMLTVS
jgi:hypothetical protein